MTAKRLTAKQAKKAKQRVMIVTSILFFLATTGFTMFNLFANALNQPETVKQPISNPLEQQEQGYEMVLQREPENTTALEGLVNTRLQMDDTQGAIEPLEKLVKLYPDRADYTTLLNQLKQQQNSR